MISPKNWWGALWALVCTVVLTAGAPSLQAQAVSGSVSGYVSDSSGASVPDAVVVIRNVDTNVTAERETDQAGLYVVTNLVPGTYTVTITAPGFRRFVQDSFVLRVDSTVRVDAVLELGPVTEEVTVSSAPPLLKSDKTDVSQSIAEDLVESLPVADRNLSRLPNTVPGVVESSIQFSSGENPNGSSFTMVNGQFFGNNQYEIDGITATAYGFSGFQIIVPTQDSVQEMKISTASLDPEFGSAAGMVAQYVTKSGSNEIHGSAFEFNRNDFSFAADPFTEKLPGTGPDGTGTGPPEFNWNQFGGSLGGPLEKNRTFLFGDVQFTRERAGAQATATVPNDVFRAGNMSAVATPIFDPLTGNADGTGRTRFSNNVIPQSRISPVARNLLDILPRANLDQSTDINFAGGGKVSQNIEQYTVRGDHRFNDAANFFSRYTLFESVFDNPPLFGRQAGGQALGGLSPQTGDFRGQHFANNYTLTVSPSLLGEFRFGFTRFRLDGLQADAGLMTNNEVGIPNINTEDIKTQGLAGIDVSGPVGAWFMGILSGVGIPRFDRTTAFQFVNNWTKISGNHQFRWGADVRRNRFDFIATNASSRGSFQFAPTITGSDEVPASGLGHASFLLGMPSFFNRAILGDFTKERQWRTAAYFQDIWRITPKLTLNYGVRFDYFGAVTPGEPGGIANFDPGSGDILLGGLGEISDTANVDTDNNNFAPRVGIAYKATQKTVVRAGFGRSYFASNFGGLFFHMTSFFPIAAQQTVVQDNIRFPVFPIETGPPAALTPDLPASGRLPAPSGELLKHRPFDNATEYVDSWNLTVEHQLARDWKVSLAYVGNVGRKLWWNHNMNAAGPAPGPVVSRRPLFQEFGITSTVLNGCNCANTSYNALQFVVEKRLSNGYAVNSAFTWSKALDGGLNGGPNPIDRKSVFGKSNFNRDVVWVLSHSWELPFGKGQKFGRNASGILDAFIGGWRFNGITTVESGLPISPVLTDGSTLNADFGQRPNRIGDGDVPNPSRQLWFNPADFPAPAACCVFGNAGRNIMSGPGLVSMDWSFWKEFRIRERMKLQLRWENFNLFNRTNMGQPVNAVDSSIAGQIFNLAGRSFGGPGFVTMRRMQFGLRLTW